MIRVLGCILLTFMTILCQAQLVSLDDQSGEFAVAHPYILEDRNATFTISDVLQRKASFQRSTLRVPDFLGNLSEAIWYKISVENGGNHSSWFLKIKGGFLHKVSLFEIGADGSAKEVILTADAEFARRPIVSNDLIYPLIISPGEKKDYYIRVTSRSLIRASMSFITMQKLYEDSVYTSYGNGFLTALAAALLLYNLFVYFSLKEKVYLYYILYIFLYIVHNNLVSGHLLALFPWTGFLHSNILLPMMGVTSIVFTNSFLQTRRYAPFIYKIKWIMASLFLIPLFIYFMGYPQLAIAIVSMIMYGLFIYWFAAGITAYRNSFKPAIYYIAGFGALILCNSLFGLKITGVIEESYWVDSALYIGTALESLILSFALAKKINFYKREKEIIQEKVYEQAITYSHELINTQETERKRIASELHDSVGQKLIVIKNKVFLFAKNNPQGKEKIESIAGSVADVIQEIRTISYGLRPYQMDLLGLTQSIKSLAEETFDAAGIEYTIASANIDSLFVPSMQINIYRIVQECFNNIVKHSRASHCVISIEADNCHVNISISDNGIGFDNEERVEGFGLRGINERIQILNGKVSTDNNVPSGTRITFKLPISQNLNHVK